MSDIVIQAEALGKRYTIGYQTECGRYLALHDVNAKLSPFAIRYLPFEAVWALKDVRLEIRRRQFEPKCGIIEMMTDIGSSGLSGLGPNQASSGPLSKKRTSQALLVPVYPG